MIIKATTDSEAGVLPSQELIDAMLFRLVLLPLLPSLGGQPRNRE